MNRFSLACASTLLFFLGACANAPSFSVAPGKVCPRADMKDGYIAYKGCLFRNVGPAQRLVWANGESRHKELQGELRTSGVLHEGRTSVEFGPRNLNLSKGAKIIYSRPDGREGILNIPPTDERNVDIQIDVLNGEWTVWVPYHARTDTHYVQMRSLDPKVPLLYNHPQLSWFTKEGEYKAIVEPWQGRGSITLFTKTY